MGGPGREGLGGRGSRRRGLLPGPGTLTPLLLLPALLAPPLPALGGPLPAQRPSSPGPIPGETPLQAPSPLAPALPRPGGLPGRGLPGLFLPPRDSLPSPAPVRAFLASALLPGTGQRLLGQDRWAPYLALELWSWLRFLNLRGEGRALRRRYRDLAWFVARRVSEGPRRDGDFDYYEAILAFPSSGAYDADPWRPGVQPEPDQETFNGSVWALARALFFPADSLPPSEDSPAYRRALAYYRERAYGPAFAWDWGDDRLQQAEYGRLIRRSDEALRRATTMLGVILGNHFLSAVDALISARLRRLGGPVEAVELRTRHGPFPPRWRWEARLSLPR